MNTESVKVILLKERSEYLIGNLTELDEEPSILIEQCYSIVDDETLTVFPLYTEQRDLFLTFESIFTILDPTPKLLETYKAQ
jgi:hypothetical protein